MNAITFRVEGRVQGVGFRAFTRRAARAAGVVGWCRNTADGAVEGVAQGPPTAVQRVVRALHQGPPASVVRNVRTAPVEADGTLQGFAIRR